MRKLAIFSFSFALSVAVCIYLGISALLLWLSTACIILSIIFMCLTKKRRILLCSIIILGLSFGCLYCHGYEKLRLQPAKSLNGSTQEITIEILEDPKPSTYGYKVTGQLGSDLNNTRVLLYYNDPIDISLSDTLTVTSEIRDSMQSSSGNDFLYYQTKDISLVCIARSDPVIEKASSLPVHLYPAGLAQIIRGAISRTFSQDSIGFMQALLTGDRSDLSDAEKGDLTRSGISHVIAISGMHVSVLLAAVFYLSGRRKRLTALFGIPIVLLFAAMVGFTPSVTRAAIMQIVFLMAPILKRENDIPTTLGFSLLLILLSNPWAISSLSLQLSYTSILGIRLFAQPIYEWLTPKKGATGCSFPLRVIIRVWQYVAITLATTFAAYVFTLPLIALTFGQVSILSALTNALILWAISICFILGYIAVAVSFIWGYGATLAAWLVNTLTRYILTVAQAISKIPYASLSVKNTYFIIWCCFAYLLTALHICLRKRRKKLLFSWSLIASLLLCVGLTLFQPTPNASITAVDVGQGQCIIFRSKTHCTMYDCGGSDAFDCAEAAAEFLENEGQLYVNCLIVSHYDSDHVCGIPQLLRRVRVDSICLPDVKDDSGWSEIIEDEAARYDIPIEYIKTSVIKKLPTGTLSITPPLVSDIGNSASLCALFQTKKLSALVTGDMDIDAEQLLLRRYMLPDVDVLIAGHHGSKYSTGDKLLRKVDPEYVLISVGKNVYGHPSPEALHRIIISNATVYRTDECGTITIKR